MIIHLFLAFPLRKIVERPQIVHVLDVGHVVEQACLVRIRIRVRACLNCNKHRVTDYFST